METLTADDYRKIAKDLYSKFNDIQEVCLKMNADYEKYIFYVARNRIFLDCSDFSNRDIEILKK